jgi:hypothetical protein
MRTITLVEKYHLIATFETALHIERDVFVSEFQHMTKTGCHLPILPLFDIFRSKSKKHVSNIKNSFKIREE